jgi:hypothetical protein
MTITPEQLDELEAVARDATLEAEIERLRGLVYDGGSDV